MFRISTPKDECVVQLEQQLHEKDMKLTDIRLEALSSAHQLEQLRDTMNRMKVIQLLATTMHFKTSINDFVHIY